MGLTFTMKKSNTNIDFLDVEILKGRDGRITTDIYHKPTDSFNYITFDSGQPRHTKVNIPFNMARRIRTIVSDERSKQKLEDLKAILESKNYQKKTRRRWNQASKKYPTRRTEENKTTRRKQQHQYCLCHSL